jgi:hypothetical protein
MHAVNLNNIHMPTSSSPQQILKLYCESRLCAFTFLSLGGFMQEAGAEDKLFATLDTRIRAAWLSEGKAVLLVDTVGFIQGLPHDLVAAFRATLEEALCADLLVGFPPLLDLH